MMLRMQDGRAGSTNFFCEWQRRCLGVSCRCCRHRPAQPALSSGSARVHVHDQTHEPRILNGCRCPICFRPLTALRLQTPPARLQSLSTLLWGAFQGEDIAAAAATHCDSRNRSRDACCERRAAHGAPLRRALEGQCEDGACWCLGHVSGVCDQRAGTVWRDDGAHPPLHVLLTTSSTP